MNKKNLYIGVLLATTVILGALGYWFLSKSSQPKSDTTTTGGFGTNPEERPVVGNPNQSSWQDSVRVQIRHIADSPISGFTFSKDANKQDSIRYIERQTGHVQNANLDSNETVRVSNTTIPGSQEILWTSSGRIIFRFLDNDNDTVRSFSASTTGSGDVEGLFLANNLNPIVADPKTDRIFYLSQEEAGVLGFLANSDGSKPQSIFSNVLREWLVQWPSTQSIYLTTKASALVSGALLSLNTKTGVTRTLLSGIDGLNTLVNPQGTRVLYSFHRGDGYTGLAVYDIKNDTYRDLSVSTLAEKCAWGSNGVEVVCALPESGFRGSFPDIWYQGGYFFTDELWSIDTQSGTTTQLASFTEAEPSGIDAINLRMSENGEFLGFMNKRDLSLWTVRLENATTTKSQ